MVSKELLESFCSKDNKKISLPFNYDGYTYATDGKIAVRVKALDLYSGNTAHYNMADRGFMAASDDLYRNLPEIPKPEDKPCRYCNGTGTVIKCLDCDGDGYVNFTSYCGHEYEFECKECEGVGNIPPTNMGDVFCDECNGSGKKYKISPTIVCGVKIDMNLLYKISLLPNVKIAYTAVEYPAPIPFKFDGGDGIVMTLTKD